jgi:hypothetical protein
MGRAAGEIKPGKLGGWHRRIPEGATTGKCAHWHPPRVRPCHKRDIFASVRKPKWPKLLSSPSIAKPRANPDHSRGV